eukprot:10744748-Lingulodinium_polyedra.AAC.1
MVRAWSARACGLRAAAAAKHPFERHCASFHERCAMTRSNRGFVVAAARVPRARAFSARAKNWRCA